LLKKVLAFLEQRREQVVRRKEDAMTMWLADVLAHRDDPTYIVQVKRNIRSLVGKHKIKADDAESLIKKIEAALKEAK
jgi:hypothetical protein